MRLKTPAGPAPVRHARPSHRFWHRLVWGAPAAVVLVGVAVAQEVPAPPLPQLVCEQAAWDFGRTNGPAEVRHVFVLENRGAAPLVISDVRTCCGVTATLGGKTIPAGTNTTLEVGLSLADRKGPINKRVFVQCNDPTHPFFEVRLIGSVVPR
jgi:hypothetical protein